MTTNILFGSRKSTNTNTEINIRLFGLSPLRFRSINPMGCGVAGVHGSQFTPFVLQTINARSWVPSVEISAVQLHP